MKTTNHTEIIRQASHYTMNGLIDPRLLEPNVKVASKENIFSKIVGLLMNKVAVR